MSCEHSCERRETTPFRVKTSFALFLTVVANLLVTAHGQDRHESSKPTASPSQESSPADAACGNCHASIYNSYKQTPMARSSGVATDNLIPADFRHGPSGVQYRIYSDSGRAWLSFDRGGDHPLHGKRELLYYIGSGRRGLTYLFADDGFFFESPINWYGDRHLWDMTPAYQNDAEAPLNLPVHTSCLHCHVSGMRPPLDGTENRYAMPLLKDSGVSCERCHGDGTAHIKGGPIVNPAKLSPERRDAICMQCHMEGRVSVERPGKHVYEFRPGDSLSDYIRYYVLNDPSSRLGAVSQVEALAQSMCKRKSGDAMSCTSCHDPHYSPPAQERVGYFRGKCLACHGAEFGLKHHPEQKDCTACHMSASASTNVAHTEVTDHRIPRLLNASLQTLKGTEPQEKSLDLIPFPDSREAEVDLRDFALAWESLANTGVDAARPQATELLRRSAAVNPNDAPTLAALGFEEQTHGNVLEAQGLYRHALALDPNLIDAATNLGVIEAQGGNLSEAIDVLQPAFQRSPGRSAIGINLARVFCLAGKLDDARASIQRVLEFNPDEAVAKRLSLSFKSNNPNCTLN